MVGGQPGKALEIGAVARMRQHQRSVERGVRQFRAPQIQRASAKSRDHGFGRFALAPWRQHAAGHVAGRLRHGRAVALVYRDLAAGLGQQQGLPRAGNACTDDVDVRMIGRGIAYGRRLKHPCPFAGMTRIRFKGSPRHLRYLSSMSEPPSEQGLIIVCCHKRSTARPIDHNVAPVWWRPRRC